MTNLASRFEQIIEKINVIYGLIIPVGLFTVVAALQWVFSPQYFQQGSLTIYLCIIISVGLIFILHLRFVSKLKRVTVRFLYAHYHIALAAFCYFVVPYLSPYDFLWAILAIGVDLLFGRRWIAVTLATYTVVLMGSFYRSGQNLDTSTILWTVAQIVGVFGTALLVSKYRQVSDDERAELDRTSKTSAFERQRLLSLINNMGEAVIATDESGMILLYNGSALDLLDSNQSLQKKNIDSVLNLRDSKNKPIKMFALAKKSPIGMSSSDYRHQFKPGDTMSLYINISPIKLGFQEESQKGFIVLMRDITKEKSLEEERDEFISVVSHELRTPVTVAEGNISNAILMVKNKTNQRLVQQSLNDAHEQIIFLSKMINDLATLSRAEHTEIPLDISEISLTELLARLEETYKPQAESKGLKLATSLAKDTQPIHTSELYVKEILQNFITNAIKYTKKGSILIHARTNNAGNAVFSVADTGIGLSKTDTKHVFDKFFRSEDFRTRESSGTGLGLYVTAKLAARIQATIDLESELNKGTTFTVTVPSLEASKSKK